MVQFLKVPVNGNKNKFENEIIPAMSAITFSVKKELFVSLKITISIRICFLVIVVIIIIKFLYFFCTTIQLFVTALPFYCYIC